MDFPLITVTWCDSATQSGIAPRDAETEVTGSTPRFMKCDTRIDVETKYSFVLCLRLADFPLNFTECY